MSRATLHYCDVCRRDLPVLGGRSSSKDTSVYRFKRHRWRFFSSRLSWAEDSVSDLEVCGDCWTTMRDAALSAAVPESSE